MTVLRQRLAVLGILAATMWAAQAEPANQGRNVGDGQVLYDIPYDPRAVAEVTFVSPTVAHPYYEIVLPLGEWTDGKGASVQKILVNGVDSDSYYVFVDGFSHVQSQWITREADTAPNVVVVTRSVWHSNEPTTIEIRCTAQGAAEPIVKTFTAKAPASGGAPDGFRRYQSVVLHEETGLARVNEPVECSIVVREEDCADLETELRLFLLDPKSNSLQSQPVQTFNPKSFAGRPPGTENPDYLKHPSKSIDAVFLASVPANDARVFVFLYDNPTLTSAEAPSGDLVVTGDSLGAVVENQFYVCDLDDKSGQIASFIIKGRDANPAPKLTNSLTFAVHWNPDSFADNGLWGHTFGWNPPDETLVTTRGPLMFRITNRGRMPDRTPQVHASVTYSFYAGVPYVKITTITEVRDSLNASAVRNGEIVLDSHLVTHFVWQDRTGTIRSRPSLHGPNWQDEWATRVDHDVPWLAVTNEMENYGIAELVESSVAFNPTRGEATTHRPAFYLYYHHFWGLPVTYFTRGWVYPFSDYQRGPILPVDPGSTYLEKMAFYPATLGEGDARYAAFQSASYQIKNPLAQRWGR